MDFNFKKEEQKNADLEKKENEQNEHFKKLDKEPENETTDIYRDYGENDEYKKFTDAYNGFNDVPESVHNTDDVIEDVVEQHYTAPEKIFHDLGDD